MGAGFFLINPHLNLLLALIDTNGLYDYPKGAKDAGETPIMTATRECFEECSILIEDNEMMVIGPFFDDKLVLFCATTEKQPAILRNEKTGIIEHIGYEWVTPNKFLKNCVPYLVPISTKIFSVLSNSSHPVTTDYI